MGNNIITSGSTSIGSRALFEEEDLEDLDENYNNNGTIITPITSTTITTSNNNNNTTSSFSRNNNNSSLNFGAFIKKLSLYKSTSNNNSEVNFNNGSSPYPMDLNVFDPYYEDEENSIITEENEESKAFSTNTTTLTTRNLQALQIKTNNNRKEEKSTSSPLLPIHLKKNQYNEIPLEVWLIIFSFLPIPTIYNNIILICRDFYINIIENLVLTNIHLVINSQPAECLLQQKLLKYNEEENVDFNLMDNKKEILNKLKYRIKYYSISKYLIDTKQNIHFYNLNKLTLSNIDLTTETYQSINSYGFYQYEEDKYSILDEKIIPLLTEQLKSITIDHCICNEEITMIDLSICCIYLKTIEIHINNHYLQKWILQQVKNLKYLENLIILPYSSLDDDFLNLINNEWYSKNNGGINYLEKLKSLQILEKFNCSNNLLFLNDCVNLEKFTILLKNNNQLVYLPKKLKEFTIDFGNCISTTILNTKLNHLKKLNIIGGNDFSFILNFITNIIPPNELNNLEIFTIDIPLLSMPNSCHFPIDFSKKFTKLKILQLLSISRSFTLPQLKDFDNLEYLDLTGVNLFYDNKIIFPKRIKHLNLSGQLKSLPLYLEELISFKCKLEIINDKYTPFLYNCDFTNWSNSLLELIVTGNKNTLEPFLSPTINKLRKLQKLTLTSIGLQVLPNEFYELLQLQYLNISNNHVNYLSKSIAYFSNLYYLNFENNNITKCETSVFRFMKSLEMLKFDDNPFVESYKSLLKYQQWQFYPTYNMLMKSCKLLLSSTLGKGFEIEEITIINFIEYYKTCYFTIGATIRNLMNLKVERKYYEGFADKKCCQIYGWRKITMV
ncbi:hypothetical protein ABK040_006439 [Willaertia magna]